METLLGRPQHYDWGSTTAIPELLGETPDGRPWAEVWYGAHPAAPSLVDGHRLDDILADDPAMIGAAANELFGGRLPYLVKLLAAKQALSLQAHPSREQAEAGFARENAAGVPLDARQRLYVDDWPKPELMCALTEFHALCGFREPSETLALLKRFGCEHALRLAEPLSTRPAAEALQEVFAAFLTEPGLVSDILLTAQDITSDDDLGQLAKTALDLAKDYPGDPGIAASLLINRITLSPGDAIFLPAAIPHAYLHGLGVELMANSNNVLRGGLTSKHVDVDELRTQLDFRPYRPDILTGQPLADGLWHYDTPAPEFALWRVEGRADVPAQQLGRILLTTSGQARVTVADDAVTVGPGEAVWLPAGDVATVSGDAISWVSAAGVSST